VIVVDASVVANVVGDDDAAGRTARALLRREQRITAPDLVDVETASVLRRRWLAGSLDEPRFEAAVTDLVGLPMGRVPTRSLMRRIFELRANVTPYDACYVALAEALGCPLFTLDGRLARSPRPRCRIEVVTD